MYRSYNSIISLLKTATVLTVYLAIIPDDAVSINLVAAYACTQLCVVFVIDMQHRIYIYYIYSIYEDND